MPNRKRSTESQQGTPGQGAPRQGAPRQGAPAGNTTSCAIRSVLPGVARFQIITEHAADHIIALDAGLGFDQSSALVMVQIFTQAGRTAEVKQRLYRVIAQRLGHLGIKGEDMFINITENAPQDWSFAHGRAQYLEGELAVPGDPH